MINISDAWYRVSAKALIFNDQGQFLLCKESDGMWDLSGGGLDHGESTNECIVRELREELGCEVTWIDEKPSYFIAVHKPTSEKKPWIANVCYRVALKSLDFTPSDECMEIRFFDMESVLTVPVMENIIALLKEMKNRK